MRRIAPPLFAALSVLTSFAAVPAAAADEGASLHEQNCRSCHGPQVYTRPEHKVTTRAGLSKQVRRCELALGLRWFDEQIESVADYLNAQYYHF